MSPTIWTRCAATCRPRAKAFACTRVVESQYVKSTRRLVDTDAEQELLEALIDGVKPPLPASMKPLHYLLSTPFRHPPLRNGSRFGRRSERGLFYASDVAATALAEVAYYRLVFLAGTRAQLPQLQTEHTAFTVDVAARRFVDLQRGPFGRHARDLGSPSHYAPTQQLGADLRAVGVDAIAYRSARDPAGGTNFALFEPVFAKKVPRAFQTWSCTATRDLVEFREKNFFTAKHLSFPRRHFLVRGRLPSPAV